MTWHEKAYVTLVVCLTLLPVVLSLLLFVWYKQLLLTAQWRRWVVMIGMVLAFVASLPLPFFYIALSVLPTTAKSSWLPPVSTSCLFAGMIAGLIAIPMLGFAKGKVRWSGIASAMLSVVVIYVALMALSL
jgi:hypothetical protein